MKYSGLNYTFQMENMPFHVPMAALERFERFIPSHSHGKGCYAVSYTHLDVYKRQEFCRKSGQPQAENPASGIL